VVTGPAPTPGLPARKGRKRAPASCACKVQDGAERQSLWDKTFIFLAALAAILGVGMIVYGFHEVLQTLEMIHLPVYWPMTF
jgi:hypothetical protein